MSVEISELIILLVNKNIGIYKKANDINYWFYSIGQNQ